MNKKKKEKLFRDCFCNCCNYYDYICCLPETKDCPLQDWKIMSECSFVYVGHLLAEKEKEMAEKFKISLKKTKDIVTYINNME